MSTKETRFLDAIESLFTCADVDGRESLSNILGKPVRQRTADGVTFADVTGARRKQIRQA